MLVDLLLSSDCEKVATRCREVFGPAVSCNFKASVFQMFQQDSDGCIKARLYLTYLHQRAAMIHMVCHYLQQLTHYD
jgi:hypothetical protein